MRSKKVELGSEFYIELEKIEKKTDSILSFIEKTDSVFTDSGRSAFRLFFETVRIEQIFLPDYLCESILSCIPRECEIVFYSVTDELSVNWDCVERQLQQKRKNCCLYLLPYFGKDFTEEEKRRIREWKERYDCIVVEDRTHKFFTALECETSNFPLQMRGVLNEGNGGSVYQEKVERVDTEDYVDYVLSSIRKWVPISDGGVITRINPDRPAFSKKLISSTRTRKIEAMVLKKYYLEQQVECNEVYRKIFMEEEEKFDTCQEILRISQLSRFLLYCYSIQEIKEKRKRNAMYVADAIKSFSFLKPVLSFESGETPFTFPIYTENRDKLRAFLIQHRIYCAVHWPMKQSEISRKILSLPIDQRYGEEELSYMIRILEEAECVMTMD